MSDRTHEPGRLADLMKRDWNDRAREDARWFINSLRVRQTDEEFDETGRIEVERLVLADLELLTGGRDPQSLNLLEIGCGAGRMTRHLAGIFGRVAGVDVSGEMIRQAGERLQGIENVSLQETSGFDFSEFPDESFDLILSAYVFQHVPSVEVIESNLRDAWRVLKPGGMLRFQTNAIARSEFAQVEKDTWVGAAFTEPAIRDFARGRAARLIAIFGAGTQYCWTTMRKPLPDRPAAVGNPTIVFSGNTYDAECREISCRGGQASLTLILTDLDDADCNDVVVRILDEIILPRYVGPIGENFRPALEKRFGADLSRMTQVEIGIPSTISPGRHPVSVEHRQIPVDVEVTFAEPGIESPRICSVTNAIDGGMDIFSSGPKSRIQILLEGAWEESLDGDIEIELGQLVVTPVSAGFLPEKQLVELVAQLPEGVSGMIEMQVRIGQCRSRPVHLSVLETAQ
ncbi:MAG: class I SAM-dependent methyltransferase [Acidobacteriota bacterium]|nr:MAG: class I SAM-dependent methyltransferase [Acidobacteriota bacterium]